VCVCVLYKLFIYIIYVMVQPDTGRSKHSVNLLQGSQTGKGHRQQTQHRRQGNTQDQKPGKMTEAGGRQVKIQETGNG